MKILSVVWFKVLPARFGGQKGTADFNRYLAATAPLVCLAAADNVADEPLPYRLRAELPVGKKNVVTRTGGNIIRRVAAEESPTHIILEYPYYARSVAAACRRSRAFFILHAHNIEYRRFRELGKWWWPLLRRYEGWAMRRADLVLFKTADDRDHAVRHFGVKPAQTMLVPYGVSPHTEQQAAPVGRQELGIGDNTRVLLFAGTLDYAPNAEAVKQIYERLAPALDASGADYRILICGRNREAGFQWLRGLQHPKVTQLGEVPEIVPYYQLADRFINPVLSGGGVQTKVIDALAAGIDVVSFAFGLEGIRWESSAYKVQCIGDADWNAFAAAALLPATRRPADSQFFETYRWDHIARQVSERLQQL